MTTERPANVPDGGRSVSVKAPRKKPAKGIPVRQKTPSARSHPQDTSSASQWWADFEMTVIKLVGLSNSAPRTVDSGRLTIAVAACLHMLEKTSRLGGEKAEDALGTLFNMTKHGCTLLARAVVDKNSRDALLKLASLSPEWPVILSPQGDSINAVKNIPQPNRSRHPQFSTNCQDKNRRNQSMDEPCCEVAPKNYQHARALKGARRRMEGKSYALGSPLIRRELFRRSKMGAGS